MSTLQLRLKNCIQTILELEPQIGADLSDRYFVEEFIISATIFHGYAK